MQCCHARRCDAPQDDANESLLLRCRSACSNASAPSSRSRSAPRRLVCLPLAPDRLAIGKGFQHVDEVERRLVKKMVHRSRGAPPDRLASERLKPLRGGKKDVSRRQPSNTNQCASARRFRRGSSANAGASAPSEGAHLALPRRCLSAAAGNAGITQSPYSPPTVRLQSPYSPH